jgi:hypothetical protein
MTRKQAPRLTSAAFSFSTIEEATMSKDPVKLRAFGKMIGVERYKVRRLIEAGTIEPQGVDERGDPVFSLEYTTKLADRLNEARKKGHRCVIRFAGGSEPIPIGPTREYMSPQTFARLTAWKRRNVLKPDRPSRPSAAPVLSAEEAAAKLRAHIDRENEAAKAKAPKGPDWSKVADSFRASLKKVPRT